MGAFPKSDQNNLLDLSNSNLHVNVVHLHSVALLHQLCYTVNLDTFETWYAAYITSHVLDMLCSSHYSNPRVSVVV